MADRESRTEQATPRRREKLREEGRLPRSGDLLAVAAVVGGGGVLAATFPSAARALASFARRCFSGAFGSTGEALGATVPALATAVGPTVVGAAALVGLVGAAHTRGLFALELALPKLERLAPGPRLSRLFVPSPDMAAEVGKMLVKVVAVGVVVWRVAAERMPRFGMLSAMPPALAAAEVGSAVLAVALHGAAAFALVAAADVWLAQRRFDKESKMSRDEVRREHKEEEGDPNLKRRIRQKMRELGRRRMLADVATATVVVANPTHVSVALRYRATKDAAPVVVAKGSEELAGRIRAEARRHGVPVVENRPLARLLHAKSKLGRAVPVALYRAVAEVIAHVYRLQGRAA